MRHSLRLQLALAALVALAGEAPAQEPWKASYYPYLLKGPNDQLSLVFHYQYGQAADYDDKVPFQKSLSLEGGINGSGSRWAVARFKAPRLAKGWRLYGEAGAVRENRYGYYGLGNDTPGNPDAPEGSDYFTRVERNRYYGRVEVTRQIVGPLQVAIAGSLTDASYSPLPGDSRFQSDFYPLPPPCAFPGCVIPPPPTEANTTDAMGRVTLVLDTRDNEFLTTKGLFAEAGFNAGSASGGYTGYYGIARGYLPMWVGSVLAVRVAGRHLTDSAPLDARSDLSSWERTVPVLGGPESHRSFVYGRYTGRDLLLANLEVRQTILDFGDFGAIGALAFLDAGRVKEGVPDESNDLHVGGGGGLILRILRSTVLNLNFAGGPDGFRFSMGTGYTF
jgi:hypothetical protein